MNTSAKLYRKECIMLKSDLEESEELIKDLVSENERLRRLINRMQKYFAPTSGEWKFVEAALENIKG